MGYPINEKQFCCWIDFLNPKFLQIKTGKHQIKFEYPY